MSIAILRRAALTAALALFLAACTAPPPAATTSNSDAGMAATTATLTTNQGTRGSYDSTKDPLVNPKQIFDPMPKEPSQVAQDQTLIRYLAANPSTLNGIFWSTQADDDAQSPIYDGVIVWDKDFNWKPNPDMVESIESTPDQVTWTIKLKPNLKWQDGQPLTADDFVFSWKAILDDKVPAMTFKDDASKFADVQAVDAQTVRVINKTSLPVNRWTISYPIVPKHIFDNPAERQKDPTLQSSAYYANHARAGVVGNGPYKLVEWIPNDRLVYERWDGYTGEKPYWKRLILKIQPDRNTALQLFKKGELDELQVTPQQFAFETIGAEFAKVGNKVKAPEWSYSQILWNMDGSNPFFGDKKVRVALAEAFNMDYVLKNIGYNLNTRCMGIFHPDSWMFNHDIKPIDYDLTKAGQLLDEAGWPRNGNDGWRYKVIKGTNTKFEFEMLIPQSSMTGPQIAAIFGEDLKKIGVSLKTRVVESAALVDMQLKHNFQAAMGGWGTGVYPDTNENIWKTEMYKDGRNFGAYSNPRVDELFQTVTHDFDDKSRTAQFQEIHKLIYEDQPCLFIWNASTLYVINNKLRGLELSPRGLFGYYPSYYKWWIPAGATMHSTP